MNLAGWSDLFIACAGAGSALAGLIIVAMSVNIERILSIPTMTSRAATTIAGLVLIVVISCLGLIPDQPVRVAGATTTLASTLVLALALRSGTHILRQRPNHEGLTLATSKAALGLATPAGAWLGSVLLSLGQETGLYIIAAAIIIGFATAVANAWVLLVEVLR